MGKRAARKSPKRLARESLSHDYEADNVRPLFDDGWSPMDPPKGKRHNKHHGETKYRKNLKPQNPSQAEFIEANRKQQPFPNVVLAPAVDQALWQQIS